MRSFFTCSETGSLWEYIHSYESLTGWTGWVLDIYISNYEKPKPPLETSNPDNKSLFLCEHKQILIMIIVFKTHRTLFAVYLTYCTVRTPYSVSDLFQLIRGCNWRRLPVDGLQELEEGRHVLVDEKAEGHSRGHEVKMVGGQQLGAQGPGLGGTRLRERTGIHRQQTWGNRLRTVHKVLTYVEYRAVPGVFQNIDTPPSLHPASVSSPRTKGGGYTGEGMGGQYFGRRQTLGLPLTV